MNKENIVYKKNILEKSIVVVLSFVMLCNMFFNTDLSNKIIVDNVTDVEAASVTYVYCYIENEIPLASDYSNWTETNYWGIYVWNHMTGYPLTYSDGSWKELNEYGSADGRYRGVKNSTGWYRYTLPVSNSYQFNLEGKSGTVSNDFFSDGGTYYFGYSEEMGWVQGNSKNEILSMFSDTTAEVFGTTDIYCYIENEIPLMSDYSNWTETNYWGIYVWSNMTGYPLAYSDGSWKELNEYGSADGRYRGVKDSTGWYKYTLPASYSYYFNFEGKSSDVTYDYVSDSTTYYFGYSEKYGWVKGNSKSEIASLLKGKYIETGQEVLDRLDFNIYDVLSDISISEGQIKGPGVEVLGKDVTLFEFNADMELPIVNNSSITVDTVNKKIKVLIGVKDTQKANVGKADNNTAYWSQSYNQVKSMYQNITGKKVDTTKLWNEFSSLRGDLKKINGSMGFDCDTYIAGYAEFSYTTGSVVFSEGGIITELDFGTTLTCRWPSFPVAYVEFGLSAGVNGTVSMKYDNSYYLSGNVGGEINGSFAVGLGEKNISKTYIEGKMDAELSANLAFPVNTLSDSLTIDMTGNLYLNAYGLGFKLYSNQWEYCNCQLYPELKSSSYNLRSLAITYSEDSERSDTAIPIERDYTTDDSLLEISSYTFKKSDIFAYNEPSLVKLSNGDELLVWLDDDGTKSDINRTSLFYSVYNGSAWTKPAVADNNDGFNSTPVVVSEGEKAYILWQKAPEMSEESSYEELSEGMELYYMVYEAGSFSEAVKLTDNTVQELAYNIAANDGDVVISWIENSENDAVMSAGTNTFKYIEITAGVVSNVKTAFMTEYPAADLVTSINAEGFSLYSILIKDTGYEINEFTSGISKVLYSSDNRLSYLDIYEGRLLYLEDNTLFTYNPLTGVAEEFGVDGINNYEFISNGENDALLTLLNNGNGGTSLYISNYDNDEWSVFTPLVDDGTYIRNYSPIMNADGLVQIAINSIEVNENPEIDGLYGAAELYILNGNNYFDIIIGDYIEYDEANVKSLSELPVSFEVTNMSATDLASVEVEFKDELTGETQNKTLTYCIPAGTTEKLTATFELPDNMSKRQITLTVSDSRYYENNLDNNSVSTTIGYADISFENVRYVYIDRVPKVILETENVGLDDAEDIILVVKDSDTNGDIIYSEEIGSIKAGESIEFEFDIPDKYLEVKEDDTFNSLYFEIETNSEEMNLGNNYVDVVYAAFDELYPEIICINHVYGDYVVDVEPTEDINGVISRHCVYCDIKSDEAELPYIKFSGASLTLYNDLSVNYKINKSLFEETGYTNPYVKFVLNGVETIVNEYRIVDDKYVFDFTDIAPNQMNDIIYATLYAEYNGVEYSSETREYSVATYCYNMLEKYSSDEYAEFRTLLVDLLNYGAESQIYTNYNTDNLVNASLTEEQTSWGTVDTPTLETVMDQSYATIDNPTVTWKGAGLNLQDSVTMRFKIATDNIDDLTVKVTSDIGEWSISNDTFEQTDGGYYVFFDGLNAGQMSVPVYLTVYNGDTAVSNTIRYSIESYAYSKQNSSDEKLNNLLIAMMKYGNSAYSYIN